MQALRHRALQAADTQPAFATTATPLIRVEGLEKTFNGRRGRPIHALKGVSIEVLPGESVGLVGETGSGKTTLGRCLVGLETPSAGTIEISGIPASDFQALAQEQRKKLRRTIQMVFQDPYSTLNPRHSVRRSLTEALRTAGGAVDNEDRIVTLLREVGLPGTFAERLPASLSGGERQRVAIARSLAVSPKNPRMR